MDFKHFKAQIPNSIKSPPSDQIFSDWQAQISAFADTLQQNIASVQGEERTEQRTLLLFLYGLTGNMAYDNFQDKEAAIRLYETGLQQAAAFLDAGETTAEVREHALRLSVYGGIMLGRAGWAEDALAIFQPGLDWAEAFLDTGETAARVREMALKLFVNAGITLGRAGRREDELALCQRGLDWAGAFLDAGETAAGVREMALKLSFGAGGTLKELAGRSEDELALYQCGLDRAKTFLDAGETAAGVREQALKLSVNAASALERAERTEDAQALYWRALDWAEAFLNAGESAADVREHALMLYSNAGPMLGRTEDKLALYQRGLDWAGAFLNAGETAIEVHGSVLHLYLNYASVQNNNRIAEAMAALPILGLWSWALAGQISPHIWSVLQGNWYEDLKITLNNPARFSRAMQDLLLTAALRWHQPRKPWRHFDFLPAPMLLRLSRALYALSQGQAQSALRRAYHALQRALQSETLHKAQALENRQKTLAAQHEELKQGLPALPENGSYSLRTWLRHPLALFRLSQWADEQAQAQRTHAALLEDWKQDARSAAWALSQWLADTVLETLNLPVQGLENLPAVMLGICFIGDGRRQQRPAAGCARDWQSVLPWQDTKNLQPAFAAAGWRNWSPDPERPHPILAVWTDPLSELRVDYQLSNSKQPDLQNWMAALETGDPAAVRERLTAAWEAAQQAAKQLARVLAALAQADYRGLLFNPADNSPALQKSSPEQYDAALATVLQGRAQDTVNQAAENFLKAIGDPNTSDGLNAQFTRLLSLLSPPHAEALEQAVQGWGRTVISEQCAVNNAQSKSEQAAALWTALEYSRAGLHGLHVMLPDDWADETGKALWNSLQQAFPTIVAAQKHGGSLQRHLWPPLQTWLEQVEKCLPPLPDAKTCRVRLQKQEALLQPFFDPGRKQLKVLWLDQQGLTVRDLPPACAGQAEWENLTDAWAKGWLSAKKQAPDTNPDRGVLWREVMESPLVQGFARALRTWLDDAGATHLRVIFPAPLGQLPWEALPELEDCLARTVSLSHWLKQGRDGEADRDAWVLSTGHLHEH
ncbi:MAG: hypothetical protein GY862_07125, partial [Gammaproteobacteria bacterium]|nr:hypothetical protein [Gammaproteobacteria bacterium]